MLTRRIIKEKKNKNVSYTAGIGTEVFFLYIYLYLDGSIAWLENGRKFRRYNNMLNPIRLKWLTIRDSRLGIWKTYKIPISGLGNCYY